MLYTSILWYFEDWEQTGTKNVRVLVSLFSCCSVMSISQLLFKRIFYCQVQEVVCCTRNFCIVATKSISVINRVFISPGRKRKIPLWNWTESLIYAIYSRKKYYPFSVFILSQAVCILMDCLIQWAASNLLFLYPAEEKNLSLYLSDKPTSTHLSLLCTTHIS